MIAENEIVLTYLLQLMAERGILDKLAFKGGTCLRKMFIGSGGRFSTDLDFTRVEEHDHEDVVLDMMEACEHPFHGIQFDIPSDSYYETQDGLSWGVNPTYAHDWNPSGQSEIRLQVSRREVPTLPPLRMAQSPQSYFQHLPFDPADIMCLALAEIIAEKIRACYQRAKARDVYDLSVFAKRPLDRPLIRRLVVLKLWQASDGFDPKGSLGEIQPSHRLRLGRSAATGPPNASDRPCSDHFRLPSGIRLPRGTRSPRKRHSQPTPTSATTHPGERFETIFR